MNAYTVGGRRPNLLPSTSPLDFMAELDVPAWMGRGRCKETYPEAFFPDKGGSAREAKRICGTCPVRVECLAFALDNDERFGIWGGFSERERRNLKKNAHAEPRICELEGCDQRIPMHLVSWAKYCSTAHTTEAHTRRAAADQANHKETA